MLLFVKLKYIKFQKFVGEHLNTENNQINKTLYWSVGIIHDKLALAYDMGSFFIKKILDLRVTLDATENSCSTFYRYVFFLLFHVLYCFSPCRHGLFKETCA